MEEAYRHTISDIAEAFNLHPETIRRWCREKKISYLKLPGVKGEYRFSQKDIKNFTAKLKA